MSDTSIPTAIPTGRPDGDREQLRRLVWPVAVGVLVAGVALTAWGAHNWKETLVVSAILAAVVAGVFGRLVPSRLRSGNVATPGLVLGLLGVLLVGPAFWSGLPLALGAAAVLLGQAGRTAARGSARSIAAVVLGALAVVGYFGTYALEALGI